MRTKSKLVGCRSCEGTGEGKFSFLCPFCKGEGMLDPSKCFRCGKKSSATVTTKQFGIEYVCEMCRLLISDSIKSAEYMETKRKKNVK